MGTRFSAVAAGRAHAVCAWWTLRGRWAVVRGDAPGALTAFEEAAASRPGSFGPLLRLGRAYLDARETWRAHRTLAQAREADPARFTHRVGRWIVRDRVDVELLKTVLGAPPDVRGAAERVAATRSMAFARCRPICSAAGARAGTGPSPPSTRAASPITNARGWPGRLRSGRTTARPPGSSSIPGTIARSRGWPATPAPHSTFRVSIVSTPSGPAIRTPSSRTSRTRDSSRTSTPRSSS